MFNWCKLPCEQNGDTYYCMIFQKTQEVDRNCTDHKKKSANEYENYPQKEKLETTNEE